MSTSVRMEKTKTKYIRFQYSQKDLEDACEAIASGRISLNKAHKLFKIPKSTLHNKLHHKVPMQRKLGAVTQLTPLEEEKITIWVLKKAKCGFPMHRSELQATVKKYLDANNRKTNFIDNKPGRKWLQLFLARHPEINKRNAEIISRARASVTEVSIKKWFEELNNFVEENEAVDIFEHPERIFNADETGVQMCPKLGSLLTPKNFKNSYQIPSGKEKEQVTVLCNISANGEAAPPLLVYPYKRIPRDIVESVPEEWGIGRSDSGWMVSETFLDYIKNIFHPWLIHKKIKLPIIMFLDGHKSHISKDLFEYCSEHKILLFCLYPNATHILQPCDVSFFKSLKNAWRSAVIKFKADNPTKTLSRSNFAKVFETAYNCTISKTNVIVSGFRKCGLYPLDANSVDYTKCVTVTLDAQVQAEVNVPDNQISDLDVQSTIKVLEYLTSESDRREFDASIGENETHEHPFFPLWRFCKLYLSSGKVPLGQHQVDKENGMTTDSTEISLLQGKEYVVSDLTHVTEFDEAMDGLSTPMDKNIPELDMEVLLNDDNLVFEFPDNITPIPVTDDGEMSKHTTNMSNTAIPLPWYEDCTINNNEEISKSPIRNVATSIDTYLTIPSLNNPTRKRKLTIMPYGITCKKMKEYFNEQDTKRTEKEESIKLKKALRLKRIEALEAKKETIKSKRLIKQSSNKAKSKKELANRAQNSQKKNEKPLTKKNKTLAPEKDRQNNEHSEESNLTEIESLFREESLERDVDKTCESGKFNINVKTISESKIKISDVTFGDYVLIEFKEFKSIKLFAGKIVMINDNDKKIKVDFLRKKRQNKSDFELFVYPQVRDVYEVEMTSVIDILVVKEITRRKEIIFSRDLKNVQ